MKNLFARIQRQSIYRWQRLTVLAQSQVPRVFRQLLKSAYRRLALRAARRRLAAALAEARAQQSEYTVLCFPIIDWLWRTQRPQHLLTALANAGHAVYYLRTDFEPGLKPAFEYLAANVFGLRLPGPANLDISTAEFPAGQLELWLTMLDDLRRTQQLGEVVCLVQLPFWGPLALAARERWGWRVVYDCMDELAEFSSTRPAMLSQEEALITDSDLVLTTARVLYERCAPLARRCVRVPNAADFDHFQQPAGRSVLDDLTGPIVGYYGALSDWFEPELVRAAAVAHPEWQFVLIGLDPGTRLTTLERLANVHLLGEQPYAVLPDYLHRFDAVMIPFKLNALTRATDPVKFYEYLSAGKPLVAVELPELQPYRHLYYPAANAAQFVSQLEAAVEERDPARTAARISVARKNIWAQRAGVLDEQVRALNKQVTVAVVGPHTRPSLQLCLENLWRRTDYPNFNVIVADDGTSAEVSAYLQDCRATNPRLRVIGGQTFAGACNAAFAQSRGDYVVLLTSDTVVLYGWLSGLVRHLDEEPRTGIVGALIDWVETTGGLDQLDVEALETNAESQSRAPQGTRHPVRALELVCAAVRRRAYDQAGPFDERFGQGLIGDVDFCLRVRRAGFWVVRAEDICVHHWGWAARGTAEAQTGAGPAEGERRAFEEKWETPWRRPLALAQAQPQAEAQTVSSG